MAWEPEYQPDFPTLTITVEWVHAHCIVPDGFDRGQKFGPVVWQQEALLNFYRLRPGAQVGQLAPAFFYRRSQIVLPQKAGKAPYTSCHVCVEAVGPALFAGWAKGGEVWDCRDHGCGCGWSYEYQPGEAMGQRWPTPLIQITATSEDQTDNVYAALRPMIDDGPLSALIPKTGEAFIRLPNHGRIDVVTSNARSRLGQRVTFVPQDETGVWTASAKMIDVAETQRRGLSGMGGRAEETTNAWDPNEGAVAQRTAEAAETQEDIFRLHPLSLAHLSYRNKAERRKIHRHVYKGCRWVDLDAIEAEAAELITVDPGQAERFYGNRPVAGSGAAFDIEVFEALADPRTVAAHSVVVIGVDGARREDALAMIATDVKSGYQWPLGIWERPKDAGDDYEHPPDEVDAAMLEGFDRFNVWRVYCDDQWIDHLVELWANRWGDKRIKAWHTNQLRKMSWAVREYEQAVAAGDVSHCGKALELGKVFMRHISNARRRPSGVFDDQEREMHILAKDGKNSPLKKDAADAAVLSWKARGDAIEAGVVVMDEHQPPVPEPSREWVPGTALPAEALTGAGSYGPMGSMS